MGVKRGQKIETPDYKEDKVTLQRYRDASAEVLSLILDHCQYIEKASIDEVYADLTLHAAAIILDLLNEGPPSDEETDEGKGAPVGAPLGAPTGAPKVDAAVGEPAGAPGPSPTGPPTESSGPTEGPPQGTRDGEQHKEVGAPDGDPTRAPDDGGGGGPLPQHHQGTTEGSPSSPVASASCAPLEQQGAPGAPEQHTEAPEAPKGAPMGSPEGAPEAPGGPCVSPKSSSITTDVSSVSYYKDNIKEDKEEGPPLCSPPPEASSRQGAPSSVPPPSDGSPEGSHGVPTPNPLGGPPPSPHGAPPPSPFVGPPTGPLPRSMHGYNYNDDILGAPSLWAPYMGAPPDEEFRGAPMGAPEEGSDSIQTNIRVKSMLAFKSLEPPGAPPGGPLVLGWLQTLSKELYQRAGEDYKLYARVPKTITLHYCSGPPANQRFTRSCQVPYGNGIPMGAPPPQQLLLYLAQQQLKRLLQEQQMRGAPLQPCLRIALALGDFIEALPSGAPQGAPRGARGGPHDIARFFNQTPKRESTGGPQGSPLRAPKGAPQGSPLRAPKGATKGSPLRAPKGAPQGSPRKTPQGAPKGSPLRAPKGAPQESPQGAPQGAPEEVSVDEDEPHILDGGPPGAPHNDIKEGEGAPAIEEDMGAPGASGGPLGPQEEEKDLNERGPPKEGTESGVQEEEVEVLTEGPPRGPPSINIEGDSCICVSSQAEEEEEEEKEEEEEVEVVEVIDVSKETVNYSGGLWAGV
ncbi:GI15578, related [Eimeria maxima]|uniref:GI15578, related n=1 Tax=Eimeria maxima TaxID=5804 RepID=U6M488_EIMMA|nr:GI15578, related [Eimeria maxima]CDJ57254.1 GI15578, related [Eimeria maxima]